MIFSLSLSLSLALTLTRFLSHCMLFASPPWMNMVSWVSYFVKIRAFCVCMRTRYLKLLALIWSFSLFQNSPARRRLSLLYRSQLFLSSFSTFSVLCSLSTKLNNVYNYYRGGGEGDHKKGHKEGIRKQKRTIETGHTHAERLLARTNSLQTSEDGFLIERASACHDGTNTRTNDDGKRDVMEGS